MNVETTLPLEKEARILQFTKDESLASFQWCLLRIAHIAHIAHYVRFDGNPVTGLWLRIIYTNYIIPSQQSGGRSYIRES